MYENLESKLNEHKLLHKVHPSVIENQHKKAENLITNSQGLNNKISMSVNNLNNLDKSGFCKYIFCFTFLFSKFYFLWFLLSIQELEKYRNKTTPEEIRNFSQRN
jgi:hypothetical protein